MTINTQNLTPWEPGESGNPSGRPKGSKNLVTIIRELESEDFNWNCLPPTQKGVVERVGAPMRAIVYKALQMAIDGDIRAMEFLRKAGYGDRLDVVSEGRGIRQPVIISDIRPRK